MSGQLRYDFTVNGLTKQIKNLTSFVNVAKNVKPALEKNRKAQTEFIGAMKKGNSSLSNAVKGQKLLKGSIDATNKSLAKARNYLNGFKSGYALAAKEAQKTQKAVIKTSRAVKRSTSIWSKYGNVIRENTKAQKTWWDSFGRVAIGFGIAYRAINLVEGAIAQLTEAFRGGVTAMDQYISSAATVSGMLALLSTGGGGYKGRFDVFSNIMADTMKETMRIMPQYKLSIEEISDAYKELAQFGVIVAKQDVRKTLISVAAIKEIAVTTGSSSKQIRQEIQGIFNGSLRISDQFGKFLARFPELEEKLYGINKLTTSNAEKWKLATDAISEYGLAIIRANETIGAQKEILHNTLQILSMDSLKITAIYDKWVKRLKSISELLMTDQGELGSMGRDVVTWFGAGWQALDNFATALGKIAIQTKNNLAPLRAFITANWELVTSYVQLAFVLKTVSFAFHGLLGVFKAIFKWPLVIAAGVWYLKNLLEELNVFDFTKFKLSLESIKDVFTDVKAVAMDFVDAMNPKTWGSRLSAKLLIGELRGAGLNPYQLLETKSKEGAYDLISKVTTNGSWNERIKQMKYLYDLVLQLKDAMGVIDDSRGVVADHLTAAAKKTGLEIGDTARAIMEKVTGITGEDGLFDIKLDWNFDDPKLQANADRIKAMMGDIAFHQKAQFEEVKLKARETWEYVGDGFSSLFTDIIGGKIKSFEDLWKSVLTTMRDTWATAMSDMASDAINKFFRKVAVESQADGTSFLGTAIKSAFGAIMGNSIKAPTAGTTGSGMQMGMVSRMATGGIIPEPVAGIGASGRTYSFAEQGPERVLSNSDSFGSPAPQSVTVEVINKSSQAVKGKQGATRFDMKGMVTQIVLEDLAANGPMARGMA